MKRTWQPVGHQYNGTPAKRAHLSKIFKRLSWRAPKGSFSLSDGMALEHAIDDLSIPNVSKVSVGSTLEDRNGTYGILGIKGKYSNGRVVVYLLDRGTDLVVLATDFFPG